ncbi:DKNYY domain-containing protein [Chryseobacterium sp. T20]|uniref:DKNYY domain-containing protein n=1 Tax=Chryseobacterium sp. T20 TaxID=3395375 RepID=UPI0039BC8C63
MDSFIQLGTIYSKDKNHVYYKNSIFSEADPSSFIGISEGLSKDKDHVYEYNDVVKDADVATFVHLDGPYFKDKNHIYCGGKVLPIDISDADHLKIGNGRHQEAWITDGKKVFIHHSLLDEAQLDIPSFGVIDKQILYYDKNGVYERNYNTNTRTYSLKKIPFHYSTPPDNSNVFISDKMDEYIFYKDQAYNKNTGLFENLTQGQIDMTKKREKDLIKINETVQFKNIYSMFLGQANDKIYWNNEETSADSKTFEKIKGTYGYYRDKNNVYLYSFGDGLIPIEGIDSGSVRLFNTFLADKDYIYTNNHRVIKSEKAELLAIYEGSWPMCGVGNPVSSTLYLFKNIEGYWLALISNKNVEVNNIKATDPSLKKFLGIK